MKLPLRIALISLGATCLFSVLIMFATSPHARGSEYMFAIGLGCLLGAAISVVLGIILLVAKAQPWGMGFLIASGLLFLVGFATCTGGLTLN